MFHSILVPLDGSPFGEHALPLAATIARHVGAGVHIVHAHRPDDPRHPDWYLPVEQRSEPEALKFERAYLEVISQKLRAVGVSCSSALLEGLAVPSLCDHVKSSLADLVVMTTHGRGPLSRFWLGSVADAFVRQISVPLVLVRPQEEPTDLAAEVALQHILIPLDGSTHAEAILEPALAIGEAMGAVYTLLCVVQPVPLPGYDTFGYASAGTDTDLVDQLRQQSISYLDKVAERLRDRGLHVRTQVLVDHSAACAILTEAESRDHDLIALETHGRDGASRLFLGSVADKVIRGTVTPILLHHSPEP